MRMAEPFVIVALGKVHAMVIKPPPAFRAIKRCTRGHFRAIENGGDFGRAHEFVRIGGAQLRHVFADFFKTLQADLHAPGSLRRLKIVVDEAAQLVFDLRGRQTASMFERSENARAFRIDLRLIERRQIAALDMRNGVLAREPAIRERAEHVVVRHGGHVARRV